jgi:hypothetical protein
MTMTSTLPPGVDQSGVHRKPVQELCFVTPARLASGLMDCARDLWTDAMEQAIPHFHRDAVAAG